MRSVVLSAVLAMMDFVRPSRVSSTSSAGASPPSSSSSDSSSSSSSSTSTVSSLRRASTSASLTAAAASRACRCLNVLAPRSAPLLIHTSFRVSAPLSRRLFLRAVSNRAARCDEALSALAHLLAWACAASFEKGAVSGSSAPKGSRPANASVVHNLAASDKRCSALSTASPIRPSSAATANAAPALATFRVERASSSTPSELVSSSARAARAASLAPRQTSIASSEAGFLPSLSGGSTRPSISLTNAARDARSSGSFKPRFSSKRLNANRQRWALLSSSFASNTKRNRLVFRSQES
mmetsp:Transcript_108/g.397  ORF Transcript_108/g.397 Transcript_108/m.397 type:complete len:297 (-) Transcript_108:539-1429(-)